MLYVSLFCANKIYLSIYLQITAIIHRHAIKRLKLIQNITLRVVVHTGGGVGTSGQSSTARPNDPGR